MYHTKQSFKCPQMNEIMQFSGPFPYPVAGGDSGDGGDPDAGGGGGGGVADDLDNDAVVVGGSEGGEADKDYYEYYYVYYDEEGNVIRYIKALPNRLGGLPYMTSTSFRRGKRCQ